ncbi:MAG TPA: ATP-binding protein [Thermoanaerobaculia bacterium]|nr:ATP-binding protein [Thermoanaerobaculia bacterium]
MRPLGLPRKLRLSPVWPALAAVSTAGILLWLLLPGLFEQGAAVQILDALRLFSPIVQERLAAPPADSRAPGDLRVLADLEPWLRQLASSSADRGLRITLIAADGSVLADSARTPAQRREMENQAKRPEVVAALAHGQGVALGESDADTTDVSYVYGARALRDRRGRLYILRFAEPLEQLGMLRGRLATALGLAIVAAGVAIMLSSLWLDRRLFRPLARLIDGAADLAGGRARRVEVPDEDELGALGRALNRLAETAETQFAAVRRERDHLQAILASMSEGVLVVSTDGRVVLANPAFCRLFDLAGDLRGTAAMAGAPADFPGGVTGRPVVELIRRPELARIIDDTLRSGEAQSGQIELQLPERRTLLLASAALSGGERGAVVVARDTTELTRVADMRRDFVANVSHELKTPLAAIRGYAETLRDGALDDVGTARRFTDRLLWQCRRLQALLDDLLTLSRLESVAQAGEREAVELGALAQRAVELLSAPAREKRVRVEIREQPLPPLPAIQGDADGLERLLVNLLDNAIKYNRPGGEVTLRLERAGNQVVIEVGDTGIGIPQESLARIFERFYRVDKGRSREEGGTGLGLAIVKHVAQSHGGQVEVESRMGRGSTFRVRLPIGGAEPQAVPAAQAAEGRF